MTEEEPRRRPTMAELLDRGLGWGGGRYRYRPGTHSPKPIDGRAESWTYRRAELVCDGVRGKPHLLAYLAPPMVYEIPQEWVDQRAEAIAKRGSAVLGEVGPRWQMVGRVDNDGELLGLLRGVALGEDFSVLCRCRAGLHHVDGVKLQSVVEGQSRRTALRVYVAGVASTLPSPNVP